MVLKSDYGKIILEVNDSNVIYKKLFKKYVIKKSDIRSIFYDESVLGMLTYSGRVYSISINSILWSERSKLDELRKELNKESILFNYSKITNQGLSFFIWWIPYTIINIMKLRLEIMLLVMVFILFIIAYFYRISNRNNIIYNIDTNELEVIRKNNIVKYKKREIDEIKVRKQSTYVTDIQFIKNKKKYDIYFKESPYLIKIYGISLVKLFN